ncbi:hypothetical protein [Photobacterium kishitanii]|uniref:Uncharacterized protein n=1 Tax=Photobacterium kishitanii TaxID=318456 RepID=A0A2T3KAY9_9GAMM|nr:hypothetical protein [Photobacterium kishitanii]PSU89778.1 hypothetical protein C9J27_24155 [Photobacterium kishitanii]
MISKFFIQGYNENKVIEIKTNNDDGLVAELIQVDLEKKTLTLKCEKSIDSDSVFLNIIKEGLTVTGKPFVIKKMEAGRIIMLDISSEKSFDIEKNSFTTKKKSELKISINSTTSKDKLEACHILNTTLSDENIIYASSFSEKIIDNIIRCIEQGNSLNISTIDEEKKETCIDFVCINKVEKNTVKITLKTANEKDI